MPLSLLLASMLAIPALPMGSALVLTLAAGVALLAALGPPEAPPSEEIASAAVFAMHGHV